jgi:hypothetical protein
MGAGLVDLYLPSSFVDKDGKEQCIETMLIKNGYVFVSCWV